MCQEFINFHNSLFTSYFFLRFFFNLPLSVKHGGNRPFLLVEEISYCLFLFCVWQERDSFTLKLEDCENWLYEDGEDQQKQVYIDKLAELKVN